MELGLIRKVDIDSEMQQSYLDYAMSVIVQRALPDARDGLKPVQRRVLYAMYDMGMRPDSAYKKSARIVGEVLGKYHPHGDVAVYESMARLAQDFTMRYMLVDGQGNFGSVDGDPPAAMRYTEARLSTFAMEMLGQIERDTVNFNPNFDGTLSEPEVLPAAAPNLLVNGASGIAVGMATNIPPHNLGEVVDALILLLHEWERLDDISVSDLMRFVQGPDFPTGGIILQEHGQDELLQAYATGRGRVTVRGRVQKEDMERGKSRLIISELPYQVNKSSLIERIADLVREDILEGIADLRDESDRQGMRIVIELKAGTDADQVLRQLYQRTPLESTFGIMLLALVENEPHLLSLKQALRVFLEHRLVVVQRRSEFDLAKARARAHILEGLRVALANLDAIIALIKAAPDAEHARDQMMRRFKLSEVQAQAILDMQLRRLAALERKKIEQEYKELLAQIKDLEALLKSPKKMRQEVEVELLAVKEKFNDKRRTHIIALKEGKSASDLLTVNELTPAQTTWIGIMPNGTIGRVHGDALPAVNGQAAPRWLLRATTHHTLYLAVEDGRAAAVAVESIPEVLWFSEGVPLNKVSTLDSEDPLAVAVTVPPREELQGDAFLMTASRLGMVKKSPVEELPGPGTQRFMLAKINAGDTLCWAFLTDGSADVLLATAQGSAIRFGESEVRAMGLVAAGVNGIKLASSDRVIGAARFNDTQEMLTIASNGKAWRLPAKEFPVQGRYGQGVLLCKLEAGARLVGMLAGKPTQNGLIHFKQAAARALRLDAIPLGKRQRSGTELAQVGAGDAVSDITPIIDGLTTGLAPDAEKTAGDGHGHRAKEVVLPKGFLEKKKEVQVGLPGLDEKPAKNTKETKQPAANTPKPKAPAKVRPSAAKSEPPKAAAVKPASKKAVQSEALPLPEMEEKPAAPPKKGAASKVSASTKPAEVVEPAPAKAGKAAKAEGQAKTAPETKPQATGKVQQEAAKPAPTAQAVPEAKTAEPAPAKDSKTAAKKPAAKAEPAEAAAGTQKGAANKPVSDIKTTDKAAAAEPPVTVKGKASTKAAPAPEPPAEVKGKDKPAASKKTAPSENESHGWEQLNAPKTVSDEAEKPKPKPRKK
jgi:DNA gyrase subunit A